MGKKVFVTLPNSLINGKRIETHISGIHQKQALNAHLFFDQRLMEGEDVEKAKQKTEIFYPKIQVNLKKLKPYHVGFRINYENWQVSFEYLEDST